MKELTVGKNDAGQRLDRFVAKAVPLLPASLLQKYIRLKRIKIDGKGAKRDTRLLEGNVLQLYINDGAEYGKTLIDHIQAYLYAKGQWRPREEHSFTPALCNRIDRNTGGIVIAAKTAEALRILNQKIRDRELDKRYLCIVEGKLKPEAGTLKGYLFKDAVKNRVYVTKESQPGSKTCVTNYRTLAVRQGLSLVECELVTGRTHQIRAQMAAAGHPLLGDGKYGKLGKDAVRKYQALYSYKLTFAFETDAGCLSYLNGKTFQVEDVDFVREWFPEYQLQP